MTTPNLPEGFTPWNGGENPAKGERVQIIMAGCSFEPSLITHYADSLRWSHVPHNPVGDIIAYRVVG